MTMMHYVAIKRISMCNSPSISKTYDVACSLLIFGVCYICKFDPHRQKRHAQIQTHLDTEIWNLSTISYYKMIRVSFIFWYDVVIKTKYVIKAFKILYVQIDKKIQIILYSDQYFELLFNVLINSSKQSVVSMKWAMSAINLPNVSCICNKLSKQ